MVIKVMVLVYVFSSNFITEWGASDASGDGNIMMPLVGALGWIKIGQGCMWYAGTGTQSSAMFPEGTTTLNLDNAKSRFLEQIHLQVFLMLYKH